MTHVSHLGSLLDCAVGPLCERGTPIGNKLVEALVTPLGAIRRGRLNLGKRRRITFLKEAMFAVDSGDGFLPFGKPGLGQETRLSPAGDPVTVLKLGRLTIRQMVTAPVRRGRALPVILVSFHIMSSFAARFRIKCPDPIRPWTGAARFRILDRGNAGRELKLAVSPSRPAAVVFALVMGADARGLGVGVRSIAPLPSVSLLPSAPRV